MQGSHQRHAQRVANFPQVPHYEFLADTIWSQYAYGRNAVYDNGDHGNALLSKFPITHYENHDISIRGPERRGMLHCVLQPPGHHLPVHAVCVHLGLQESHRQQQLQRVCDLINSFPADEPVVLAGDFNDWRHRAHAVLQREAGLEEVFVHAFGRAVRTFPASMPLLALDRIYVRNAAVHAPLELPRKPWDQLSDAPGGGDSAYDPPLLCTALFPLGAGQPLQLLENGESSSPRVRCDCQRPARGDAGDLHPV